MKATIAVIPRAFLVLSASLAPLLAQTPSTQQQQPEFMRQGQQLMREGKLDDALALYRKTLQTSPYSIPANLAAGSVFDFMGQGEEARKYFVKAIDVADTPEHKAMTQRAMVMSYAFEGNCKKTVEYEQHVFDYYGNVKNFFQQGEINSSRSYLRTFSISRLSSPDSRRLSLSSKNRRASLACECTRCHSKSSSSL